MNEKKLYHYKATVISVYDGDTARVDIIWALVFLFAMSQCD